MSVFQQRPTMPNTLNRNIDFIELIYMVQQKKMEYLFEVGFEEEPSQH